MHLTRVFSFMALVLCLLAPQPGSAQQRTLDKAAGLLEQQARAGRGEFISFLMGAASAYRWDSAAPQGTDAQLHFCPPPRHALDGKTYARIALEEYRRAKSEYAALSEYPLDVLALALQRGLRARFPCADRTVGIEPATALNSGMDAGSTPE